MLLPLYGFSQHSTGLVGATYIKMLNLRYEQECYIIIWPKILGLAFIVCLVGRPIYTNACKYQINKYFKNWCPEFAGSSFNLISFYLFFCFIVYWCHFIMCFLCLMLCVMYNTIALLLKCATQINLLLWLSFDSVYTSGSYS